MKISKIIPLILLVGFLVLTPSLGSFSTEPTAEVSSQSTSQTIDPDSWEEMLPGVFVRYYWFNESNSFDVTWSSEDDGSLLTDLLNNTETDPDPSYDPNVIIVYDMDGNPYYIEIEEEWAWSGGWSIKNFYVEIIADPDKSFMGKLDTIDPAMRNIDIFSLNGDEVYYSTVFYMANWSYNYFVSKNYTWYDEFGELVNPNDVIPNLAPDYKWASHYNDSFEFTHASQYSMFGFSVYQHTLLNIAQDSFTILAVEHYFQGMSIFNDTNGNGIIDVSYDSASDYEDNLPEIIDDVSNEVEADESELVYHVWMTGATLDGITVPHVVDNQIDWDISLIDVSAELWGIDYYILISDPVTVESGEEGFLHRPLEIVIPHVEFDFTFLVEESTAILKTDQIVGDFTDKDTGLIPSELEGLSLTINYWSSLIQTPTETEKDYELTLSDETSSESIACNEIVYNSSEWDDGIEFEISFEEYDLDLTPLSIMFGGVYTWTKDNNEYEVGTVMIPLFTFKGDIYHQAGLSDNYEFHGSYIYGTYYYASCYEHWDGYGIIHDPTFSAIIGNKKTQGSSTVPYWTPGFLIFSLIAGIVTLGGIVSLKRKRKN
ncbi:MAG: hypothetical protein ACFE9L_20100 [Candidatus Hodarchaeota archaeon]